MLNGVNPEQSSGVETHLIEWPMGKTGGIKEQGPQAVVSLGFAACIEVNSGSGGSTISLRAIIYNACSKLAATLFALAPHALQATGSAL